MVSEMQLVFIILILTTIGFLVPRFRADLVALCSLLALFLTGLLTVQETLAGFANNVVIMIAALFIVGEGIFQTGLAKKAGNMLVKLTNSSELRLTLLMLGLVAVLSGFISNTGTVAILLPVVVSLSRQINLHPGKLLMPLAFASSMGGALTLIGTAPNLIARQSLIDNGYEALRFFAFTPVGLIILLVGIAYMWYFGRRLLDKPIEKELEGPGVFNVKKVIKQYQAGENIHVLKVMGDNNCVGEKIKDLNWASTYNVTVLEIENKDTDGRGLKLPLMPSSQKFVARPNYILQAEDILVVYARPEYLDRFIQETGLQKLEIHSNNHGLNESNIAEVILTPQSRLLNKTIKEINFRDKYGLTILAIKQLYKNPISPSPNEKLSYGDSLLVHGKWDYIDLLSKDKDDTVVLGYAVQPEDEKQTFRAVVAGIILLAMLVMLVFEWLPAVITVVIAAILMVITGSIKQTDEAYRSINWQTVVLIASMLPMATALAKTGGIEFVSEGLISLLGVYGPFAVLAGLYVITSLFSQFISNTATAVLLFPVAILTAQQMGVSPIPMVMAVAYSASMAFATPVATPPNAMVMAAGKYTFFDFVRVGIPLQIIIAIIAVIILPLFFPF